MIDGHPVEIVELAIAAEFPFRLGAIGYEEACVVTDRPIGWRQRPTQVVEPVKGW